MYNHQRTHSDRCQEKDYGGVVHMDHVRSSSSSRQVLEQDR